MNTSFKRAILSAPLAFALTFLLSAAAFPFDLAPFYLVVFVSSIALGGNFAVSAVVFLGATTLSALSRSALTLAGALQMLFAVATVGAGVLTQHLRKRRLHGFYAVLLAFFGQLFTIFFLPSGTLYHFLLNMSLAAFFALPATKLVGTKRSRALLFTGGERVLAMFYLFAFGAGAYSVMGYGITPYYLLIAAFVPLLSSLGAEGIAYASAFTLGAAATCGNGLLSLPVMLSLLFCEALRSRRRWAAFSVILSETCAFFLFNGLFSPYNFILMFTGGLFAALLPEEYYKKWICHFGKGEKVAARSVVNKARLDLSGRLGCMSDALRKMSKSLLFLSAEERESETAYRIAEALSAKLCAGCKGFSDCKGQSGGDTADLLFPTAARALAEGKVTIVDLSPYLNSNCHKVKQLLELLNEYVRRYADEKTRAVSLAEERNAMAGEAEGLAGILDVLKRETRRVVTFDGERERRIVRELAAEGITAYDAMVTEDGDYMGVTVTMSESDAENPRAAKAVSRAIGAPLIAESVGVVGAGSVSVGFASAPCYDVIVGEAVAVKDGSEACGDTKSVTRLGSDKVMVALSDGMGSGDAANDGSAAAISLVESFYKTGVEERVVLPLINRLLTVRNDGTFQTLDMCVIDLRTGEADFIKLSAPESVIKRKGGSEIVEGGALPLGILREVRPSVSRKKLSAGDVVVLMTDGVTDAIGADGVVRVIEGGRTNHPQTIAENVLADASYVSQQDDRTVLALRLYRRLDGDGV